MDNVLKSINFSAINNKSTRNNYEFVGPKKILSLSNNTGEITGDLLDNKFEKYELGMPVRSSYTMKEYVHNPNEYRIFDLNQPQQVFNIKASGSFDNNNFSTIEGSMKQISSQLNPTDICSEEITRCSIINYISLNNSIDNSFSVNSIGLYSLFAYLYISSDSITEIELKKYFNYPDKNILLDGINKIFTELLILEDIFYFKNIILIPNNIQCNHKYIKQMKKIGEIIVFDINSNINDESEKINKILLHMTKLPNNKKIIIPYNLIDLDMMLINTININPIWEYEFDSIVNSDFYISDSDKYSTNFLRGFNMPFSYYENENVKLVEIPLIKNISMMGIIIQKTKNIEFEKLKLYISQLKKTVFKEILIPMFTQQFKIRYTDILKETGLKSIFTELSSNIFDNNMKISDVIQNIFISVDNKYHIRKKDISVKNNSTKKLLVNIPFIYYFRLSDSNTVFYIGKYQ